MFAYGETVAFLTAGAATDEYGNTVESWTAPTEAQVKGVGVEPRPLTESNEDSRNAVTSGFTLYVPPGVTVRPAQRARVRGVVYEVLGEPAVWRSPFTGWEPGSVVQVGRVDG